MKFLYYPGCSQKATSRAYDEALRAVCPGLGLELEELDDWNCCGATAVPAVSKVLALTLSARNLALAERRGMPDLLTPCPNCWLSLCKAHEVLTQGGALATKVREALAAGGFAYQGKVRVRHLLEVLLKGVGPEKLRAAAARPLTGLKVAPYYGCQVLRPHSATGDDPYDPRALETLVESLGGTAATFPLRTACCGGALVATKNDVGRRMSWAILSSIHEAGADLIVTPCSMCQVTMELVQYRGVGRPYPFGNLPVVNVAQLLAMAMGLAGDRAGLQRSLIPVQPHRPDPFENHA